MPVCSIHKLLPVFLFIFSSSLLCFLLARNVFHWCPCNLTRICFCFLKKTLVFDGNPSHFIPEYQIQTVIVNEEKGLHKCVRLRNLRCTQKNCCVHWVHYLLSPVFKRWLGSFLATKAKIFRECVYFQFPELCSFAIERCTQNLLNSWKFVFLK